MADIPDQASLNPSKEANGSLADMFLAANQELARSDARIYRSIGEHLQRTRAILDQEARDDGQQADHKNEDSICPRPLLQGQPSFERQLRADLICLCKRNGIRGYSRMNKKEIIARLDSKGVVAPPTPLHAFSKAELLSLIEDLVSE